MQDITVIQNQFGVKAIHRFESKVNLTTEQWFEALNGMGPHRNYRNRISISLTARDYICIDGQWYYCASFGWEERTAYEMVPVIHDVVYGEWT